jgi:hypothetical protein
MAEPPIDASNVASTFPDSPPFWRDFTTEKVDRMESLRRRYADQTGLDISTIVRVPDVPEDLVNLQPPPEPADGKWRLFGEQLTVCVRLLVWFARVSGLIFVDSLMTNFKALKRRRSSALFLPEATLTAGISTAPSC